MVSGGNGIMNVRLRKEESRHYFDNCSSKLNISSKKNNERSGDSVMGRSTRNILFGIMALMMITFPSKAFAATREMFGRCGATKDLLQIKPEIRFLLLERLTR